MTLIVEDGSIVPNANTYLSEAGANAILENFGYTLDSGTAETNLRTAAQYLESFRNQYQGEKVSCDQSLQWPRGGAYVDCCTIPSNEIPEVLKFAQALAAYETEQGNALQATTNGQTVIEKTIVGAVSVKYGDNGQDSGQLTFKQIDSYIQPLLKSQGLLRVYRV